MTLAIGLLAGAPLFQAPPTLAAPTRTEELLNAPLTTAAATPDPDHPGALVITIARGSSHGVVVGAHGILWPLATTGIGDLAARGVVIATTPTEARVRLTPGATANSPATQDAFFELPALIPSTAWRGPILRLALHAIDFTDNAQTPLATLAEALAATDDQHEERILTAMVAAGKEAVELARKMNLTTANNPGTGQRFHTMDLGQALDLSTIDDYRRFLGFVLDFPGNYLGRTIRVSEAYATWLLHGEPPSHRDRLAVLTAATDPTAFLVAARAPTDDDFTHFVDHVSTLALADTRDLAKAQHTLLERAATARLPKKGARLPPRIAARLATMEASIHELPPWDAVAAARSHTKSAGHYKAAGLWMDAIVAQNNVILRLLDADRFDEALREIDIQKRLIRDASSKLTDPSLLAALPLREAFVERMSATIDERRGDFAAVVARLTPLVGRYLTASGTGVRESEIQLQLMLARALGRLGRDDEAHAVYTTIDGLAADLGNLETRADLAWERGELAWRRGLWAPARTHYQASLDLSQEAGSKGQEARALASVGQVLWKLGDGPAALLHHAKAIAIREAIGHRVGLAWGLRERGRILVATGDREEARTTFERALAIRRELASPTGIAEALNELGNLAIALKRPTEALAWFTEATAIAKTLRQPLDEAFGRFNIALAHATTGAHKLALAEAKKALAIFDKNRDRETALFVRHYIGDLHRELGDPTTARKTFEAVIAESPDGPLVHSAEVALAEMDLEAGLLEAAASRIERIRERAERGGAITDRLDALALARDLALQSARFDEASELARLRLELARKSTSRPTLVDAAREQASALIELGRLTEARAPLEEALTVVDTTDDPAAKAWVLNQWSSLHRALGHAVESRRTLEEAVALMERAEYPPGLSRMLFNHALALHKDNDFAGALAQIDRATRLAANTPDATFQVALISGRALILEDLERWADAERDLTRALAMARSAVPDRVIGLLRALGSLMTKRNRHEEGLTRLREAVVLETAQRGDRGYAARAELGIALSRMGRDAEALPVLEDALTRARKGEGVLDWWEPLYELGRLNAKKGDTSAAIALMKEAVLAIERSDGVLTDETARARYYADKLDVYRALIKLLLGQGEVAAALEHMERAKVAEVQRLDRRLGVSDPGVALATELDVQEGKLQSLLDETLQRVPVDAEKAQRLDEVLANVRSRRAKLLEELDRNDAAFDRYALRPLQLEKLREHLRDDDTMILAPMLLNDGAKQDTLVVFVVTRRVLTHFTQTVPVGELDKHIKELARELDPRHARGVSGLASLKKVKARAHLLYDLLLKPAFSAVGEPKTLVMSPLGSLRYVPWAALHSGDHYVIEHMTLVVATALDREKFAEVSPRGSPDSSVLLFSDPDGTLPFSRAEASAIQAVFKTTEIFDGAAARISTLKQKLRVPGFDILHLATHGRLDQDTPEASHIVLADGRLDYAEMPALNPIKTRLIVLSACQTAVHAGGDGSEIYGLAYQLLRGPTHSVMASLWEVSDQATSELFTRFYTQLREGQTFHEALAVAQRGMIADPLLAHPALWAPFFLMGAP